jgi:hypothetical protein
MSSQEKQEKTELMKGSSKALKALTKIKRKGKAIPVTACGGL